MHISLVTTERSVRAALSVHARSVLIGLARWLIETVNRVDKLRRPMQTACPFWLDRSAGELTVTIALKQTAATLSDYNCMRTYCMSPSGRPLTFFERGAHWPNTSRLNRRNSSIRMDPSIDLLPKTFFHCLCRHLLPPHKTVIVHITFKLWIIIYDSIF